MKNVTITLPDDVAQRARVEAAKAGLSLSAWFRKLAEEAETKEISSRDKALQAAWDRLLSGPTFDLGFDGKLPSREERNARR